MPWPWANVRTETGPYGGEWTTGWWGGGGPSGAVQLEPPLDPVVAAQQRIPRPPGPSREEMARWQAEDLRAINEQRINLLNALTPYGESVLGGIPITTMNDWKYGGGYWPPKTAGRFTDPQSEMIAIRDPDRPTMQHELAHAVQEDVWGDESAKRWYQAQRFPKTPFFRGSPVRPGWGEVGPTAPAPGVEPGWDYWGLGGQYWYDPRETHSRMAAQTPPIDARTGRALYNTPWPVIPQSLGSWFPQNWPVTDEQARQAGYRFTPTSGITGRPRPPWYIGDAEIPRYVDEAGYRWMEPPLPQWSSSGWGLGGAGGSGEFR